MSANREGPKPNIPPGKRTAGTPASAAAIPHPPGSSISRFGSGGNQGGVAGGDLAPVGFEPAEGFAPGFIDGQVGWRAFAAGIAEAHVETVNPATGVQHLQIANDPGNPSGTTTGAFSPNLGNCDDTTFTTVLVDVNISALGGADYDVVPQAPTQGLLTTRVVFSNTGDILVLDDIGAGLVFVDTGADWIPGQYVTLRIVVSSSGAGLLRYFYPSNTFIYNGVGGLIAGTSVEELVILSDNANVGDVGDFDNVSITSNAPCTPLGACCNADGLGGCNDELTQAQCIATGTGVYQGDNTVCSVCFPLACGPGAGPCNVQHPTPGCDDEVCCAAVCAANPSCCSDDWDALCVFTASKLCPVPGDPVFIATGPSSSLDGYLDVSPDVFGSYASAGFGGQADHYNPVGPAGLQEAAFSSGLYLFVGDTQRELLSDNDQWQGVFPGDGSLDRIVTAANSASDTNGDGVNDTLTSGFNVSGGDTDLSFDVTQHVERIIPLGGNPVAILTQDYTITNNSTLPIDFELVSTFDGDLLWVGDFEDDTVGTGTNGSPGVDRYVYEGEVGQPATAITISSPTGDAYAGSKLGINPAGGPPCPDYGFGTDVQVWEAYGIPDCWRNHIAAVGYDTDGESGGSPPNCGAPCDALALLEIPVALAAGAMTTVTVTHTYGANAPVGGGLPCPWDLNGSGDVGILDLLALLAAWGPCPAPCPPDFDGSGTVDIFDLLTLIANWGACP
ncbi:MAG: hypothetical protein IH889_10565 [Planctomycetes bacterium]|nr:hypothetical protein [Planctomycetota bacterium]